MRDEDRDRILHMIEAAESIARFIAGRCRDDLDRDEMLLFAIERAIEILGEAASPGPAPACATPVCDRSLLREVEVPRRPEVRPISAGGGCRSGPAAARAGRGIRPRRISEKTSTHPQCCVGLLPSYAAGALRDASAVQTSGRRHPLHRLARDGRDPIVVVVVVKHGKSRRLGGGGDHEVDRLRSAMETRRGHCSRGLKSAYHHIGRDRSLGQGSALLDNVGDIPSSGAVDDLEVDQPAGPKLPCLRQGRQPFPDDILPGAGEHRRIDEVAHGSAHSARSPSLLDPRQVERPRASQPLDVSHHPLVIHEPLQGSIDGLLDRAAPGDAPSPLQQVVVDLDESFRHAPSISDPRSGYTCGLDFSTAAASTPKTARLRDSRSTFGGRRLSFPTRAAMSCARRSLAAAAGTRGPGRPASLTPSS
jgi:hypothetical protein